MPVLSSSRHIWHRVCGHLTNNREPSAWSTAVVRPLSRVLTFSFLRPCPSVSSCRHRKALWKVSLSLCSGPSISLCAELVVSPPRRVEAG